MYRLISSKSGYNPGCLEVDIMIKLENSQVQIKDDAQDVLRPSKRTNKHSKSGNPYLL
jgi:hypothetical protein